MNAVFLRAALGALTLAALSGCASQVAVPPLTAEEAASFRSAGNYLDEGYRLEPGDSVRIAFPFHAAMDRDETIRPDGRLTIAEVGEVDALGLTTTALERLLESRTSTLLKDPEVRVTILGFAQKSVYVTGEVRRPGVVPYRSNLTPLQAVAAAGGMLDTAFVESVVLIRAAGAEQTPVSRRLNLQETIAAGDAPSLELAPHDVLYVPRTAVADADLWIDQHVTRLFPFIRGTSMSMPLGF